MTDVVLSTFTTGSPSETTVFSAADINSFDIGANGNTGHIVYARSIAGVPTLYHTSHSLTSLGTWPAVGTHIALSPSYTPITNPPAVIQPKILVNGTTVHVLWSYFTRPYGYVEAVTIGTGYASGDLAAGDIVYYNGSYYEAVGTILSTQIDSDAEVDALLITIYLEPIIYEVGMVVVGDIGTGYAGPDLIADDIVTYNGNYYKVIVPLTASQVDTDAEVNLLIQPTSVFTALPPDYNVVNSGAHHPDYTMVTEYFISTDGGSNWLSEVIFDKTSKASYIINDLQLILNDSESEESGTLYLIMTGYDDKQSTITTYDNFIIAIKGVLNNFSNPKKLHAMTSAEDAISSTSLFHYFEQENDFLVLASEEPKSINTNTELDDILPDNANIATPRFITFSKTKSSIFTFPPDEPIIDAPEPLALNTLGAVLRNEYDEQPIGKIDITSTGNIWVSYVSFYNSQLYATNKTQLYDPSEYTTIGTAHAAVYHGQIVKVGSGPYAWYKIKKKNIDATRPGITQAFAADSLSDNTEITNALIAGEIELISEPSDGVYSKLRLYDPTLTTILKEIDPHDLPTYASRATTYSKAIYDFIVDKNDNLWLSYGYFDYNPSPQHWNMCKYEVETDTVTPVYFNAHNATTTRIVAWTILNTLTNSITTAHIPVYTSDTKAILFTRLQESIEYHISGIVSVLDTGASDPTLTLTGDYEWVTESSGTTRVLVTLSTAPNWGSAVAVACNTTISGANKIATCTAVASASITPYMFHNQQLSKLSISKNKDWVAFHGRERNTTGSGQISLFHVDTALPSFGSSPVYYVPHAYIPSGKACVESESFNLSTVHITDTDIWAYYMNRSSVHFNEDYDSGIYYANIYKYPLPIPSVLETQYILNSYGSPHSYFVPNMASYSDDPSDVFDKEILGGKDNTSNDYNYPSIVSDDNYVYIIFNNSYNKLMVYVYLHNGTFYKKSIVTLPDLFNNSSTYYVSNTGTPENMSQNTQVGTIYYDRSESVIDDTGLITYCGAYQFSTADILSVNNTKLLSFHHAHLLNSESTDREFNIRITPSGTQYYVYVGDSWPAATKKAKILEKEPKTGTNYASAVYDNTVLVVEPILGTFTAGDLIKEYDGSADTNTVATLLYDECLFSKANGYLLESANLFNSDASAVKDFIGSMVYHDNSLYISNYNKELKVYNKSVSNTQEMLISNACTSNGTLKLRFDPALKSGNGCSIAFTTSSVTNPHVCIQGQNYSIDDEIYISASSTDFCTFKVTDVDSFGGVTSITQAGMDTTVSVTNLTDDDYSFFVENYITVSIPLTTTQNTTAKVATLIANTINSSTINISATAVGNKVTLTYFDNRTYDLPIIESNGSDVQIHLTTVSNAKLISPVQAANRLLVSKTALANGSTIFNSIREALDYAETTFDADSWCSISIGAGEWYEDIVPNPAGTTQNCNYIIKAARTTVSDDMNPDTAILGSKSKAYNKPWARSGTTITITWNDHSLITGDTIEVTSSTQLVPLPLGSYSVTKLTKNTFSIVGVDSGATSGTAQFTTGIRSQHGTGLIEIKESGTTSNRVMVFEGLLIKNEYVPVMTTSDETGARYLMKRTHDSVVDSNETIIFNKCLIYNSWSAVTPPGDSNDTHYYNSRNYGFIKNTSANNEFVAVYYHCVIGRAQQSKDPFFTNSTGTLASNESIKLYFPGSTSHGPTSNGRYVVTPAHADKYINHEGFTPFSIGMATSNTDTWTIEPLPYVKGHTSELCYTNITGNTNANYTSYYYLNAADWFDNMGNIKISIPRNVYITILSKEWSE